VTVENYSVHNDNIISIMNKLSIDLKVPIGIEVKDPAKSHNVNKEWTKVKINKLSMTLLHAFQNMKEIIIEWSGK